MAYRRSNPVASVLIIFVVVVLVVLLVYAFLPSSAEAQSSSTSTSGSSANVSTSSNSNAGGGSANNQIYLDQRGPDSANVQSTTKSSGGYTVRSAPAVQAPSMGSGHPCGLGGSIGISIIGGGAAGGATSVDEACLLAQMGQGEAALRMIARRDSEACLALRSVGRIPAASTCTREETRNAQAAAKAQADNASRPVANPLQGKVQCDRNAAGQLVRIRVSRGVDHAQARAYCG